MVGTENEAIKVQDVPLQAPLDIKPGDIVMAVMGVTGSGKTTFVNLFADFELEVGDDLESCTQFVQVVPCTLPDGKRIYLADTPGFDDSRRSDSEILREVADWLSQAHTSHIKLTGIIYLHRISDARMGGKAVQNTKMFKKLCGDDGLKSVILATTMWETTSRQKAEQREAQLETEPMFWKPMIDQGSKVLRHDAGLKSGSKILQYLIDRKRPVTLDIQREMVDQNLQLAQTGAGVVVTSEVEKARHQYEERLRKYQIEFEEAHAKRDLERKEEIQEQVAKLESKIMNGEAEVERMRVDREQIREEMKQRYEEQMAKLTSLMEEKDLFIKAMEENHSTQLELQKLQMRNKYLKAMLGTGCVVM